MQSYANRVEAKVQALSWLVSQLRWEHTLDALRDGRPVAVLDHAFRAA
jgi:hypothetical protein